MNLYQSNEKLKVLRKIECAYDPNHIQANFYWRLNYWWWQHNELKHSMTITNWQFPEKYIRSYWKDLYHAAKPWPETQWRTSSGRKLEGFTLGKPIPILLNQLSISPPKERKWWEKQLKTNINWRKFWKTPRPGKSSEWKNTTVQWC